MNEQLSVPRTRESMRPLDFDGRPKGLRFRGGDRPLPCVSAFVRVQLSLPGS